MGEFGLSARSETEGVLTILVSPVIAVLAMVIGCSILDSNQSDYGPTYMAARMGAMGGPFAGFICVLVSSTVSQEVEVDTIEPIEVADARRKIEKVRKCWGIITPYIIGIVGGPIGSAILRAAKLAESISPLTAVRAAAVGGIFATPIYYAFAYFLLFVCDSGSMADELEVEEELARARALGAI